MDQNERVIVGSDSKESPDNQPQVIVIDEKPAHIVDDDIEF